MTVTTKEIKIGIDTRLFESISEIAKRDGITNDKVMNDAIERGLNVLNDYDYESFSKMIDEARTEKKKLGKV